MFGKFILSINPQVSNWLQMTSSSSISIFMFIGVEGNYLRKIFKKIQAK